MKRWWWLSFSGGPDENGLRHADCFRGVAIVRARDFEDALEETWRRQINPGGEVQGMQLKRQYRPPKHLRNRLLGREEAELAAEIDAWRS